MSKPPITDGGPKIMAEVSQTTTTTTVPQATSQRGALMTEASYERIKGRIRVDLGKQSPSAWVGAAFMFIGIGVSAALAHLELPGSVSGLPAGTRETLVIIAVAAAIGAGLCLVAHFTKKTSIQKLADDICDEMDVYSVRHHNHG